MLVLDMQKKLYNLNLAHTILTTQSVPGQVLPSHYFLSISYTVLHISRSPVIKNNVCQKYSHRESPQIQSSWNCRPFELYKKKTKGKTH